jgi:hypothetical protein
MIPISYFVRMSGIILFLTLDAPNNNLFFLYNALLVVGNMMENIAIESLFSKHLPA